MKRILVIEDNEILRRNVATILSLEDFEVEVAEDGKKGLERARHTPAPDLIVCDIVMPAMDGVTVLQALRADQSTARIPFIFLTARGDRADLRTGMDAGADDYLTKPASREELLSAVRSRLARQELHQRHAEETAARSEISPNFSSPTPLESLGLTTRQAEVLLWLAQGKSNQEIATIVGATENTVKKHLQNIFDRLGLESRHAASLQAIEVLSRNQGLNT